MGRKNRNKNSRRSGTSHQAATAAAAAAGAAHTLPAAAGPTDRPLKGVISTNEDPFQCPGCNGALPYGETVANGVFGCCGKSFCLVCVPRTGNTPRVCPACRVAMTIRSFKKAAKAGSAWAQYCFGLHHEADRRDDYEAHRWYQKAASQGHPLAHKALSDHYHEGSGCIRSLGEAREHAEKALAIMQTDGVQMAAGEVDATLREMCALAASFVQEGWHEEVIPMMTDSAEDGFGLAQYVLARAYDSSGDYARALDWARKAAMQATSCSLMADNLEPGNAANIVAMICLDVHRHTEGLFWGKVAAANGYMDSDEGYSEGVHSELCRLRKTCSTCGTELRSDNRKLCGGCKMHCYCSRACQKTHWNHSDGGHREECKDITKIKEGMEGKWNAGKNVS